jgi:hypothetical protein
LLTGNSQTNSTIASLQFNSSENQFINSMVPEKPISGLVDSCTNEDGIFGFTDLRFLDQSKMAVGEKSLVAPQRYSQSNYLISSGELPLVK